MSPWSRAEAVGEGERGERFTPEESFERELFAGRRRALGSAESVAQSVPALAGVLRLAEASNVVRIERSARGHSAMTVAMAAACFLAALTNLPRVDSRTASIAPDVDAGPVHPGLLVEETAAGTCSQGDDGTSLPMSEARACFAPPAAFKYGPWPSSSPAAASFSPAPAPEPETPALACGAEESCETPCGQ